MNENFLPSWRSVMTPHPDVTGGEYSQAEWAVNLASVVFEKKGRPEYTEPVEFFSRTYLTDGLKNLLAEILKRVTNGNGEPVIQLKTAFGGGKTHSLLALYHLFGGKVTAENSPVVREVLKAANIATLPKVHTAVFVGTWSNPLKSTLWGELAAQLAHSTGKPELYEMIRENDEQKTSPGVQLLQKIFDEAGACLILIDEIVAYGRKLSTGEINNGGTFGNLLSFIQELTEAAKSSPNTVVVASIPESEVEIGRDALSKQICEQVERYFGRMQFVWRTVSSEEGYEIVRRRLFSKCDEDKREQVCSAFYRMYVENKTDFPYGSYQTDYKAKLLSCYPIHPKLFDFFYEKWTNLENFQRTRGILRLMAKVIYNLWQRGDRSTMIMPCDMPLDAPDVHSEIANLLMGHWDTIVTSEIDGDNSKSRELERQNLRFDRLHAARKLSRSIFMATAPVSRDGVNQAVDENEIHLCTIQPKDIDNIAVYNDALSKLRTNLYYLYAKETKYWFGVTATLRKMVDDKREKYSDAEIFTEIENRLRKWQRGENFKAVYFCPKNPADVPDEPTARLIILSPKNFSDAAEVARKFLDERGTAHRECKNMLLFLAADAKKIDDLKTAVRDFKAWTDVLNEIDRINTDRAQLKDAENNRAAATKTFAAKISQTYCRLIYPVSDDTLNIQLPLKSAEISCANEDNISAAWKYFTQNELLLTALGGNELKRRLDNLKSDCVSVKQVWEYCTKYYYMPRLVDKNVLINAIRSGVKDKVFGLADDKNLSNLQFGEVNATVDDKKFLIKAEAAQKFIDAKKSPVEPEPEPEPEPEEIIRQPEPEIVDEQPEVKANPLPKNFSLNKQLDAYRYGKEVGNCMKKVASILMNLPNAQASIKLSVKISVPDGVSKDYQELVENACRECEVTDFRFD